MTTIGKRPQIRAALVLAAAVCLLPTLAQAHDHVVPDAFLGTAERPGHSQIGTVAGYKWLSGGTWSGRVVPHPLRWPKPLRVVPKEHLAITVEKLDYPYLLTIAWQHKALVPPGTPLEGMECALIWVMKLLDPPCLVVPTATEGGAGWSAVITEPPKRRGDYYIVMHGVWTDSEETRLPTSPARHQIATWLFHARVGS